MSIADDPYLKYSKYSEQSSLRDGWITEKEPGAIKIFKSKIDVSNRMLNYPEYNQEQLEVDIKRNLSEALVDEIMKKNLMKISKNIGYDSKTSYQGEIAIASHGTTGCTLDVDKFSVKGKHFTQEQTQEAILNTFPEYFL